MAFCCHIFSAEIRHAAKWILCGVAILAGSTSAGAQELEQSINSQDAKNSWADSSKTSLIQKNTQTPYSNAPNGVLVYNSLLPSGLQLQVFRKESHSSRAACIQWLPLTKSSESTADAEPSDKKNSATVRTASSGFVSIFATRSAKCELTLTGPEKFKPSQENQIKTNIPGLIGFKLPFKAPESRFKIVGESFTDEIILARVSTSAAQKKIELLSTSIGPTIPPQSMFKYFPGLNFFLSTATAPVSMSASGQELSRSPQLLSTIGGGMNFDFFFYRPLQFQLEIFQSLHRLHAYQDPDLPDLYNFLLFGLKHQFQFTKHLYVPKVFVGIHYSQLQLGFPATPNRLIYSAQGLGAEVDLFWPYLAHHRSNSTFLRNSAIRSENRIGLFTRDASDILSGNFELRSTYYYRIKRDTLIGLSHWMRKISGKNYTYSANGGLLSLRVENLFLESMW